MNPIKLLKKTLVIEMGFAAAPLVAGFGALGASSATIAGLGVTSAATGLATSIGAATAAGAAGAGLFGGSLLSQIAAGTSILSTIAGGQADATNYKEQAKAEQFNARNREIDRKRNLVRTLALQNVRQGTSGITSGIGSSAQAVQLEDISRGELDQATDLYSTNQRVNQLKQNASNASTFSLLSAAGEAARFGRRQTKRGSL